jgi:adenine phosphoribosyltransferase
VDLSPFIRTVPDFPKPGVAFRDIAPLLGDARAFDVAVSRMAEGLDGKVDLVAGIEARGFLFGAPVARALRAGFVPLRKPGKLPGQTLGVDYALEYGEDRLEVLHDALRPGSRVVLVDDVLATGHTLAAAASLLELLGARVVAARVLIELLPLHGRERWQRPVPLDAVLALA